MAHFDQQIRAVFDAIDENRINVAERLLSNLEEKHASDHRLRAAQAFVLYRNGYHDRAQKKCQELCDDNVDNQMAIGALTHVMQNLCMFQELITLYERIMPQMKNPISCQENIAMAHVRLKNFPAAQKVFSQIHKTTQSIDFLIRATMANVAAVPLDDSNSILLKLAAKLLDEKILKTEGGKLTPEMSFFYINVLERQKRYLDALKFLQSSRGSNIGIRRERLHRMMIVYVKIEDHVNANAMAIHLLRHADADDWDFVSTYVDSLQKIVEQKIPAPATKPTLALDEEDPMELEYHTTLDQGRDFFAELSSTTPPKRGPRLGMLHLCEKSGYADAEQKTALIKSYMELLGNRPSTFLDLVSYIDKETAATFESIRPAETDDFDSTMRLAVIESLIGCCTGPEVSESDDASMAAVRRNMEAFAAAQERFAEKHKDRPESEEDPFDAFLLNAINISARRYAVSRDIKWMLIVLCICQHSTKPGSNPAILLFSMISATAMGVDDSEALIQMDFKSVQYDSLLHLALTPLLKSGSFSSAVRVAANSDRWFIQFDRETSALIAKCFNHGTWSRLLGLLMFRDDVQQSIARAESHCHNAVLQLLECETLAELTIKLEHSHRHLINTMTIEPKDFKSNDDRYGILGPLLQEKPQSDRAKGVADALVPISTVEERAVVARALAAVVLAISDISAGNEYQARLKAAHQSGGGKKKGAHKDPNAAAAAGPAKPSLYAVTHGEQMLATVAELKDGTALKQAAKAIVEAAIADATDKPLPEAAFTEAIAALNLSEGGVEGIYPVVPLLVTALRVTSLRYLATTKVLAKALNASVSAAQSSFESREPVTEELVGLTTTDAEFIQMPRAQGWIAKKRKGMYVRIAQYLEAASKELGALERRR